MWVRGLTVPCRLWLQEEVVLLITKLHLFLFYLLHFDLAYSYYIALNMKYTV